MAEMSTQSMAKIHRTQSPPALWKTVTINYGEADPGVKTEEEEVDVNRLKEAKQKSWASKEKPPLTACMGCGGNHPRVACNFKDTICWHCGRKGHLARICRAVQPPPVQPARPPYISCPPQRSPRTREDCYAIFQGHTQADTVIHQTTNPLKKKIRLTVRIEGTPCRMKVDMGSATSIVSWSTLKHLMPKIAKRRLKPCGLIRETTFPF